MFYTLAIILIISKLFRVLSYIRRMLAPLLSYNPDLAARYGKGTWAVITGASDGIGKAFAFELAGHEFNIAMVARNREKLQAVEKELKSKYPSIETRIIVQDFEEAYKENFAEDIYNQMKDVDVSFLVNNAGMAIKKPYIEDPIPDVRKMVMVNTLAPALITRVFLPQLAGRKKSAVITVSSIGGDFPRTEVQLYAATKVFVDYLSRGLIDEHKNIDFLSLRPAGVATKMLGKQPGGKVVTPEACVKSTLRSLGHTDSTHGNWKHSLQAFIGMHRSESTQRGLALRDLK